MSEDPKDEGGPLSGNGPLSDSGSRALRRGGARREVTDRVRLVGHTTEPRQLEGWSLNISRGGVRIVTEGTVELGEEFEVYLGEDTQRPGRVVWLRQERDGIICGIEFISSNSGVYSVPPAPPGSIKLPGVPDGPDSVPPMQPPPPKDGV